MKWCLNEIAKEVSNRSKRTSEYRAKKVLNLFLDIVKERLAAGDEIYLRRLGKLHVYRRRWRVPRELKWYEFFSEDEYRLSMVPGMKFSRHLKEKIKHASKCLEAD
jgi:nucleoid DNA-binding protein